MNTGFSWVRIDKGNIHCNFRYLNVEQVETVVNYLKSYYEYHNITATIIDLGASGMLQESGDHYRPSDDDPAQDYYFLVELHRHGTIIPQGCVEIMKTALNGIAQHQIIPESVFIEKLKSNQLTVGDEATLTALSTKSGGSDMQWTTSDLTVISITPDGMSCDIVAESPGTAQITASVEVQEDSPLELGSTPYPTAYWTGNIYKYTAATKTLADNGTPGVPFVFTQNNYYECVYDASSTTKYKWVDSTYDGTPLTVTYRDIYEIFVRTYLRITTREKQKLCLYHFDTWSAITPSTGIPINWTSSSNCLTFDSGVSTGTTVTLEATRVGMSVLTASITDAYGTYEDSLPVTVYALAVTPKTLKMVVGSIKTVNITKQDILDAQDLVVDWVTTNAGIASVVDVFPPVDTITNFDEGEITAQGIGQAIVTAIVEDPNDGMSYSDSVKVTVGNVAIDVPASAVIYLLSQTQTLTLTCDVSSGFTIDLTTGWASSNSSVLEITSISGTDNDTCVVTGLTEGAAIVTVTATNGSATDTDTILIKVVDAEYATLGEMQTFTHGKFNGHDIIDWDHPTGEEGTMEVPDGVVDTVSQSDVTDFVEDLFESGSQPPQTPVSGKKKK